MLVKRGRVWHTRLMFDGRLYQQSLRTRSKELATKLEAAFRTNLVKGEFSISNANRAPTLLEFEAPLLKHLKEHVAPRTYGFYRENLKSLNAYLPIASSRLHKIDPSLVEKFVQKRLADRVSVTTVNHSIRTLRRALHIAKEWKLIRDVPMLRTLRGENRREAVLSEEDLLKMVQYAKEHYAKSTMQFLLVFLVDTGLRITEACELKKAQVTLDSTPSRIQILKGSPLPHVEKFL